MGQWKQIAQRIRTEHICKTQQQTEEMKKEQGSYNRRHSSSQKIMWAIHTGALTTIHTAEKFPLYNKENAEGYIQQHVNFELSLQRQNVKCILHE